ncbi:MAG: hypothetical protein QNK35_04265 [Bacteroides sp.]|nr:hypothetical protein [Bacteroides sp.]
MKSAVIIVFFLLTGHLALAQSDLTPNKTHQKGKLYAYWGWNRGWYSGSDINFSGADYDFMLSEVVAKDRQTPFSLNAYLNPAVISIPQYNFRVGYFIKDHYDISLGVDHMKYVVQLDQTVKISGQISGTETIYDGIYENDDIVIEEGFLLFEHTDGLNYLNVEFRRFDNIFDFNKVKINLTEGLGAGVLVPKTNATLLNNERYDEFHLAGYGLGGVIAVNITFFDVFFIQSELKGGFIGMPNIRTTMNSADLASQNFFYSQLNIVFGVIINLSKKNY